MYEINSTKLDKTTRKGSDNSLSANNLPHKIVNFQLVICLS